ncbi:MAG: FprA family A-type flavoprotein [Candidatus Bathyarchaeota archaeon]|nr:MAG: FprA family A-type flavoprotein [Candidatus Bathyarchaeota archaeon]
MKIMVVYDSRTGNTGKMAAAIAEGARSSAGAEVEVKKLGEPFPLRALGEADAVLFGSPSHYGNVTDGMRGFMSNLGEYVKSGKMSVKGSRAAIFGSYGWDGAWVMEEKLKGMVQELGYEVQEKVLVETGTNIQYSADKHTEKWKNFGADFVKSIA